jgi:DinB superfamily
MDLSYPIGRFDWNAPVTAGMRPRLMGEIAEAPARLRQAIDGLDDRQLDAPYRPGGWTVRQVVHHVPESHMHSFLRMRLALTEDEPTVKPYNEAKCAELADSRSLPPACSLALLENLHIRWVDLLRHMTDADFHRSYRHPEIGLVRLDTNLALYAWHGRHHTAHITGLRQRMGW